MVPRTISPSYLQVRFGPIHARRRYRLVELALDGRDVKIVEEKHYKLVPGDQIREADLQLYAKR